jgi:hypothetical protein
MKGGRKRNAGGGKQGQVPAKKTREEEVSEAVASTVSVGRELVLRTTQDSNGPEQAASAASKVPFSIRSGKPDGNHVPATVAVLPQPEQQSTTGSETQSSDWYDQIRRKGLTSKDSMLAMDLINYVRADLFPKLKFFMDKKQLDYSEDKRTICQQIIADMGVKEGPAASWWECYKNKIYKTLNSKRADVTQAIKRQFLSKLKC